jgi:two-component system NtrC family sensor kinase
MARASKTGNKARRAKAGRGGSSQKGRKSAQTKRRTASSNTRHKALSVAALRSQLEHQTIELDQALERQAATAEVLRTISRSAFDLRKVLDKLTESACRLCDAYDAVLLLREGEFLRIAAHCGEIPVVDKWPVSRDWISGRCVVDRKPVHIHDLLSEEAEFPRAQAFAQQTGHRSLFAVPLMRENDAIGAITIRRTEVRPFTDRQIELLQTFADQAVIAIENARLFNETQEALAHQTATSDVLQVIGRSMADAQPVFERILDIIRDLVGIEELTILLAPGDGCLHMAAHRGTSREAFKDVFPMPIEETAASLAMVEQRQRYFPDALNDPDAPPGLARSAEVMGNYSSVMTPMIWEGRSIGVIAVAREPNAVFSEKELRLLQTFADQAVIAIENARLFNETREASLVHWCALAIPHHALYLVRALEYLRQFGVAHHAFDRVMHGKAASSEDDHGIRRNLRGHVAGKGTCGARNNRRNSSDWLAKLDCKSR